MTGIKLAGVRVKIERADHHIRDLASQITAFGEPSPYKFITHRDPESRRVICTLTEVRELPKDLSAVTGDAIQNLRSALDHMAYLLCLSRPGCEGKKVYFPISQDAEKYKSDTPGKVKRMREDAVRAINAIEPYGGGAGEVLWRLHALNNADKHRLLLPILSNYTAFQLAPIFDAMTRKIPADFPRLEFPKGLFLYLERPIEMKVGQIIFSSEPDGEVNDDMKFRAEVSLNEPGIIEGEPLVPALQGMRDFVNNVVSDLAPML